MTTQIRKKMSQIIFFGGHKDAGFIVHAINSYYGGILANGSRARIQSKNIDIVSDEKVNAFTDATLVIPILDEWRLENAEHIQLILRLSLVQAINQGRCRLLFDFSNEAGTPKMVSRLTEIVRQCGINEPAKTWLICQNRQLGHAKKDEVSVMHFDFFVLAGIVASIKEMSSNLQADLVQAIATNNKPYQITCLNTTPRIHRVVAILEIIDQGLIQPASLDPEAPIALPYVSMSLLNDTKGSSHSAQEIVNYLNDQGLRHLAVHLPWLLANLPLKADELTEKGNQLATKIISDHYLSTNISIITETGVNHGIERITEKTVKALAHGHPLVIIGHKHSIRVAKNLGFSLMDDYVDHSYDDIDNPSERIHSAVLSAKKFLHRLKTKEIQENELAAHAHYNIVWASQGFLNFYWNQFVDPLLRIMSPLSI